MTIQFPTVDWTTLLPSLWDIMVKSITMWLYATVRAWLMALWRGSLLPIPHDLTDRFTPVLAMMPAPGAVGAAAITLVLALVGLKWILRAWWSGHHAALDFLTGRFIVWILFLGTLPWIIEHAITLEQNVAKSIMIGGLSEVLPEAGKDANIPNPIALIVMVVLGMRLWVKLFSNVVHVAVAVVWSPVGVMFGLIPDTAIVGRMWLHEFFGRLAGAVLATIAVALGLAIALTFGNDVAVWGVAGAFVAAYDYVDWLAATPGSSPAGVLGAIGRTASMGAMAAGSATQLAAGGAETAGAVAGGTEGAAAGAAMGASRGMAPYYSFD